MKYGKPASSGNMEKSDSVKFNLYLSVYKHAKCRDQMRGYWYRRRRMSLFMQCMESMGLYTDEGEVKLLNIVGFFC